MGGARGENKKKSKTSNDERQDKVGAILVSYGDKIVLDGKNRRERE